MLVIPSDVLLTVGEEPVTKSGKRLPNTANRVFPKSKEMGLGAWNDRPSGQRGMEGANDEAGMVV